MKLGYLSTLFCALVHAGYFVAACALGDGRLAFEAAALTSFFLLLFSHYRKAVYAQ